MVYKKLTIIELIIVVAILGILASLVIPNISNVKGEAFIAKEKMDLKALESSVLKYKMENNVYPSEIQPSIGSPVLIDMSKLYPKYIKTRVTDEGFYFVDAYGQVMHTYVLPPSFVEYNKETGIVMWESVADAEKYNIYVDSNTQSKGRGKNIELKVTVFKSPEELSIERYYIGSEYNDVFIEGIDKNGNPIPMVGPENTNSYYNKESRAIQRLTLKNNSSMADSEKMDIYLRNYIAPLYTTENVDNKLYFRLKEHWTQTFLDVVQIGINESIGIDIYNLKEKLYEWSITGTFDYTAKMQQVLNDGITVKNGKVIQVSETNSGRILFAWNMIQKLNEYNNLKKLVPEKGKELNQDQIDFMKEEGRAVICNQFLICSGGNFEEINYSTLEDSVAAMKERTKNQQFKLVKKYDENYSTVSFSLKKYMQVPNKKNLLDFVILVSNTALLDSDYSYFETKFHEFNSLNKIYFTIKDEKLTLVNGYLDIEDLTNRATYEINNEITMKGYSLNFSNDIFIRVNKPFILKENEAILIRDKDTKEEVYFTKKITDKEDVFIDATIQYPIESSWLKKSLQNGTAEFKIFKRGIFFDKVYVDWKPIDFTYGNNLHNSLYGVNDGVNINIIPKENYNLESVLNPQLKLDVVWKSGETDSYTKNISKLDLNDMIFSIETKEPEFEIYYYYFIVTSDTNDTRPISLRKQMDVQKNEKENSPEIQITVTSSSNPVSTGVMTPFEKVNYNYIITNGYEGKLNNIVWENAVERFDLNDIGKIHEVSLTAKDENNNEIKSTYQFEIIIPNPIETLNVDYTASTGYDANFRIINGGIRVCGRNNTGTLGLEHSNDLAGECETFYLPDGAQAKNIWSNRYTTVVVSTDGDLYGFGQNGTSTTKIMIENGLSKIQTPILINDGTKTFSVGGDQLKKEIYKIVKAQVTDKFTYFLTDTGDLYFKGIDTGKVYLKDTFSTESYVKEFTRVEKNIGKIIDFDVMNNHVIALNENGEVYTWGYNNEYQTFGEGVAKGYYPLIKLKTKIGSDGKEMKATMVKAGLMHSLVLLEDKTVIGYGDREYQTGSTVIDGLSSFHNVKYIEAGYDCSIIVLSDGTVYSIGRNSHGQLAHGEYQYNFGSTITYGEFKKMNMVTEIYSNDVQYLSNHNARTGFIDARKVPAQNIAFISKPIDRTIIAQNEMGNFLGAGYNGVSNYLGIYTVEDINNFYMNTGNNDTPAYINFLIPLYE